MEDRPFQDALRPNTKFMAIYFIMGQYNDDDGVPHLTGFDCPFEDSPALYAGDEPELEHKIRGVHDGNVFIGDFEGCYPDVICDIRGKIQAELHRRLCSDKEFDPDLSKYSFGRETLTQLWNREKWRWIGE